MGAGNVTSYQGFSQRNEYFELDEDGRYLIEAGGGNDVVFNVVYGDDIVYGQGGRDLLRSNGGDDQLFGDFSFDDSTNPRDGDADLIAAGPGDDTAYGSVGNDFLCGESGADTLYGGADNDLVYGGSGSDRIDGGDGDDILYGASEANIRTGFWADITVDFNGKNDQALGASATAGTGGNYIETAYGDSSPDVIDGGAGNDSLNGSRGGDTLTGGDGLDTLYGYVGKDTLGGGAGADTFLYKALADSSASSTGRDTIKDFSRAEHDRIDLHTIDANASASGNQAFTFIGAAAFGHHAGELRAQVFSSYTIISGDVNGDAVADFSIFTNKVTFAATDFVL